MVRGVKGLRPSGVDDIFLFQRLISYSFIADIYIAPLQVGLLRSETKLSHTFRTFRLYMASVGARLHQHIMVSGSDRGTKSS